MSSIFTRIVNAELPGHILWEDDLCYSLLTIKPIREGHVLLVPRVEIDHWDEVPAATAAHLFVVAQKISLVLRGLFPCEKVGVMIAGLEVRHTHIHLLPIDRISELDFSLASERDEALQARTAAAIRQGLREAGHGPCVPDEDS